MPSSPPRRRSDMSDRHLREDFYFLQIHPDSPEDYPPWDPWPVRNLGLDAIGTQAYGLVRESNFSSLENFLNHVELLPASGAIYGVQGGQAGAWLYSLRCLSRLPVRFHLWKRPDGKLIVGLNGKRMPFSTFLQDFRSDTHPPLSSQLYYLWKLMPEERLQALCTNPRYLPPYFRENAIAKWRSLNRFRFLDLPQEIREKIIVNALFWPKSGIVEAFRMESYFPDLTRNMALLTTCKQVSEEARTIMYSRTTICFRADIDRYHAFFQVFRGKDQPTIRSIIIDFECLTLMEFFGLPTTLLDSAGSGQQWDPDSSDSYKPPPHLLHLHHAQTLRIKIPHLRRLHYLIADQNDGVAPWPCQVVFFKWIFAAVRMIAHHFSSVEFEGLVDPELKDIYQDVMAQEREMARQGAVLDIMGLWSWQEEMWSEP